VSNGLSVPKAGSYTIRILSVVKPNAWQWNADKLGFRKLTSNVYRLSSEKVCCVSWGPAPKPPRFIALHPMAHRSTLLLMPWRIGQR